MMLLRAPAATALLATSLLLLFTARSLSIDLCNERDCANNTDLEICRPFQDSSNKTPLYLMGFFPCNTRVRARGLTVAAQMAIRAVEKNSSILPNYSMRLSFNNTKVSLECLQRRLCQVTFQLLLRITLVAKDNIVPSFCMYWAIPFNKNTPPMDDQQGKFSPWT